MTPEELETVRLHVRVVAIESLLAGMFRALTRTEPARTALLEALDVMVQRASKTHIQGVPPEYADLLSAETRDAFESLVAFLKKGMDP